MSVELTQPLTGVSTGDICWVVIAAFAWGGQPNHIHVHIVWKSRFLILLELSGFVQACNGIAFSLHIRTGYCFLLFLRELKNFFVAFHQTDHCSIVILILTYVFKYVVVSTA